MSEEFTNPSKLGHGQEPSNKQRRIFMGGSLAALAASPLLVSPRRAMAEETGAPNNPFILLLAGVYQPVVRGPNLGLSAVNLNDGSYSVTRIYPVFGIGNEEDQEKGIGNFYVQFGGNLCAYQLPEARLRCDSPVGVSLHTPMGKVDSTCKGHSN